MLSFIIGVRTVMASRTLNWVNFSWACRQVPAPVANNKASIVVRFFMLLFLIKWLIYYFVQDSVEAGDSHSVVGHRYVLAACPVDAA